MCACNDMTSLGFADEAVPVGTHLCLIFSDEKERIDSLMKFLSSGLSAGERTACFSEYIGEQDVRDYLVAHGVSANDLERTLTLASSEDTYFEGGIFDPDRLLKLLSTFYDDARTMGFPAARVIGEMDPKVQDIPGGERLLEYESRVTMLARTHPVTAICQYDANRFNGATIMDVLKFHPHMVINGSVVHNPFYMEPEVYLGESAGG